MKYSSSISTPPPLPPPPDTFTLVLSRDELLTIRYALGTCSQANTLGAYKAIGAMMYSDTPMEGDTSK